MTSLHEILESVQYELEIISMVTDDAASIMVGKTIETIIYKTLARKKEH